MKDTHDRKPEPEKHKDPTPKPAAKPKQVWKITDKGAMNDKGSLGKVISESDPNFKDLRDKGEIALADVEP